MVIKTPADFVGSALGQSENKTKAILEATVGKVLVIDEAYGLYGGGDGQGATSDPYKTSVIDTIVAKVQSVPGDDRCVLLLGYKDQMEVMFQNVNPGLSRRFPLSTAFNFQDFNDNELSQILGFKLQQQRFTASSKAKKVALEMLSRAKSRPHFGNGGEVDIILDKAKSRHQQRLSKKGSTKGMNCLEAGDFDPDFDRAERTETDVAMLFAQDVGRENLIAQLRQYQDSVRSLKAMKMDPKEDIPFNFIFKGPPGTGKTTTARKIGKVFYDMGFLSTADVIECSATDLIGQYLGQTGPKVQKQLHRALGRVLFIDEAYRFGKGSFGEEAMDELVDAITKETYYKKLVIVLAGYEQDINNLMSLNPGLSSRFSETVEFLHLTPHQCIALLGNTLRKKREDLRQKGDYDLDIMTIEQLPRSLNIWLLRAFKELSKLSGWGNARDVIEISKSIWLRALQPAKILQITEQHIRSSVQAMLTERKKRESEKTGLYSNIVQPGLIKMEELDPLTERAGATVAITEAEPPGSEDENLALRTPNSRPVQTKRDTGVSDDIWHQLQLDKRKEEEEDAKYQHLKKEAFGKLVSGDNDDEVRNTILKRLIAEEEQRKKALAIKKKLKMEGRCPAGWEWIKQTKGYRCAGGSHSISDSDVEELMNSD